MGLGFALLFATSANAQNVKVCYSKSDCQNFTIALNNNDDEDGLIKGIVKTKESPKLLYAFDLFCHEEYGDPYIGTSEGHSLTINKRTKLKNKSDKVLFETWKKVCK